MGSARHGDAGTRPEHRDILTRDFMWSGASILADSRRQHLCKHTGTYRHLNVQVHLYAFRPAPTGSTAWQSLRSTAPTVGPLDRPAVGRLAVERTSVGGRSLVP